MPPVPRPTPRLIAAALAAALLPAAARAQAPAAQPPAPALAGEVNLYTTREPGLIRPLLDAFTASSGVKVNAVFVAQGLAERVAAEGTRSPADLLMTVDIGNLMDLVDRGLTQPAASPAVEAAVPATLRDPEGRWTALSLRARVLYVAKPLGEELRRTGVTYEDLADPRFRAKVCSRSGQHPYNATLIANLVARDGPEKAGEWLKGVKANLARRPGGGDREIARDIVGGLCGLGLGNSYYVGIMRSGAGGPEQKAWGDGIDVLLPTFRGGGTHVNVSGAAVARNAPNKARAVQLLEYLVSVPAQQAYAQVNHEHPVRAGIAPDAIIAALGELKPDATPLPAIARERKAASGLVDATGFDD